MKSGMTLKERYHYAKLALFNAKLLLSLDTTTDPGVAKALNDCAKSIGFAERPPLINQAVFLQMAYVCLVWLWESAKAKNVDEDLAHALFDSEFPIPAEDAWEGERHKNKGPDNAHVETVRLIRNALSHGRVQVDDKCFRFEDERKDGKDKASLTVSWGYLGQLCERVIHKLTPFAYPPGN